MQAAGPARERAHTRRHVGMCAEITPPSSDPPGSGPCALALLCFGHRLVAAGRERRARQGSLFSRQNTVPPRAASWAAERDRKGHAYRLRTQSKLPSMRVARGRGTATVATSHDEPFFLVATVLLPPSYFKSSR